ncbi:hypothetical protein [Priestia megaterium]|uniref:hypothetical protein n=1 Tax=Priestia megaterium TaxID=1404 RepID=UPI0013E2D16A|nr:hypothetical protein [Priestia megaterium]MCM3542113.1 hypothetical protein [Priestia megaterium]MDI3094042.1 hypothetical protein [Priestia megaterium]MED3863645.1 hypothetical protein [Priestia megaterium]MED4101299.1 hypothetical protein [Priestia megaterium]MED4145148.1 hypothetical protein [Priestia megaterium]
MEIQQVLLCVHREEFILGLLELQDQEHLMILTENKSVKDKLSQLAYFDVMLYAEKLSLNLEVSIYKVIVWDDDISRICRMIEWIKMNTSAPIILVTNQINYPTDFFKRIGAKHVIYSQSTSLSFLLGNR